MVLVHDDSAETALPEMTGALAPRVNDTGIAAMHARERAAQPVAIARRQNEMHVVGHQAPGPHGDIGGVAMLGEQIAVERIIVVAEESARAAVAALGDVVRMTGDNDAGEAGYGV